MNYTKTRIETYPLNVRRFIRYWDTLPRKDRHKIGLRYAYTWLNIAVPVFWELGIDCRDIFIIFHPGLEKAAKRDGYARKDGCGYVYINPYLFSNEFVNVLGHEMGHIVPKHGFRSRISSESKAFYIENRFVKTFNRLYSTNIQMLTRDQCQDYDEYFKAYDLSRKIHPAIRKRYIAPKIGLVYDNISREWIPQS